MIRVCNFSELSKSQIVAYKETVASSFPAVLFQSKVVQRCWPIIESYFPENQMFYLNSEGGLIGFINAIPVFWDQPLNHLPNEGWDWLVNRGIEGYEKGIKPNTLGGLQIIISSDYLGMGYSKMLINEGKKLQKNLGYSHFIIPIRPIFKSKYPEMAMEDYLRWKKNEKIFDPWIRTHISNGAKVIKVCSNAMNIKGNINYWEELIGSKIDKNGYYNIPGALNPVFMNIEKDIGEYREENIWISYN